MHCNDELALLVVIFSGLFQKKFCGHVVLASFSPTDFVGKVAVEWLAPPGVKSAEIIGILKSFLLLLLLLLLLLYTTTIVSSIMLSKARSHRQY